MERIACLRCGCARHSRSWSARSPCDWRWASASPTTTRSTRSPGASSSRAGRTPSYRTPLAPTPHPLLEALGAILSPLGAAATVAVVVALAYLALAALGYLVYRLGADWFSWPVGLAGAALILSRYEVLSYGVRAYADIPYVVLVLAALAIETRRRRAGWPVIALLDLAGLLRPEAWLFAARLLAVSVAWLDAAPAVGARRALVARGAACCGRSRISRSPATRCGR